MSFPMGFAGLPVSLPRRFPFVSCLLGRRSGSRCSNDRFGWCWRLGGGWGLGKGGAGGERETGGNKGDESAFHM